MIIGLGIIIGLLLTWKEARRTGQREDDYTDYLIWGILAGVIGARLYYVLFRWDYYSTHLSEIVNLRSGGLAIYGTILGAVIALIIYCAIKKKNFFLMVDTLIPSLALAQGLGRWGNFFNMEAFGRSYDGLFSMMLRLDCVNSLMLDQEVLDHAVMINGVEYIQVVPTFLIESLWCFVIFAVLMIYRSHKRFNGEILCIYSFMYGLERTIVEGLRTDSLMLGNTGIRVSQALSAIIVVCSVVGYFVLRHLSKTNPDLKPPVPVDPETLAKNSFWKNKDKKQSDGCKADADKDGGANIAGAPEKDGGANIAGTPEKDGVANTSDAQEASTEKTINTDSEEIK